MRAVFLGTPRVAVPSLLALLEHGHDVPLVITQATYDQLRDVDVGSFFAANFADQRVPTFDEVIDVTAGKVKLIVELKSYAGDAAALATDVVRTLQRRRLLDDAVVMSRLLEPLEE